MKQYTPSSPFAALNSQEQKERWIVWQAQHDATKPIGASLPENNIRGGSEEKTRPATNDAERIHETATPRAIHHGQYDAVINRMNAARRKTSGFVPAMKPPVSPAYKSETGTGAEQPE